MQQSIRVKAIQDGSYGHRRMRAGQIFDLIPRRRTGDSHVLLKDRNKKIIRDEKLKKGEIITAEQQFSPLWMEKVDRSVKPDEYIPESDGRIATQQKIIEKAQQEVSEVQSTADPAELQKDPAQISPEELAHLAAQKEADKAAQGLAGESAAPIAQGPGDNTSPNDDVI